MDALHKMLNTPEMKKNMCLKSSPWAKDLKADLEEVRRDKEEWDKKKAEMQLKREARKAEAEAKAKAEAEKPKRPKIIIKSVISKIKVLRKPIND